MNELTFICCARYIFSTIHSESIMYNPGEDPIVAHDEWVQCEFDAFDAFSLDDKVFYMRDLIPFIQNHFQLSEKNICYIFQTFKDYLEKTAEIFNRFVNTLYDPLSGGRYNKFPQFESFFVFNDKRFLCTATFLMDKSDLNIKLSNEQYIFKIKLKIEKIN